MFLKNKIIRDTKIFILKIGKRIIKFPLSIGAIKEIRRERLLLNQIKRDNHFSSYVLGYKYFLGLPIMRCLPVFEINKNKKLIKKYFKKYFQGGDNCPLKELKSLINLDIFLNFIFENAHCDYEFWEIFLNKHKLPQSSAHGDFNQDNILVEGGKLYFIDWSRFNLFRSKYFDLIDFYIFSKKQDKESWMKTWERELNKGTKNIFGIEVEKIHFIAYAVWKVADELKILILRNSLNQLKNKKYIKFINNLAGIIRQQGK